MEEELPAAPVRLASVNVGHGEGRYHAIVGLRLKGQLIRLALPEADMRLLMEELGAALRFIRRRAINDN
jgi:hypothetical protein